MNEQYIKAYVVRVIMSCVNILQLDAIHRWVERQSRQMTDADDRHYILIANSSQRHWIIMREPRQFNKGSCQ